MIQETAQHMNCSVFETFEKAYTWHNAHVSKKDNVGEPRAIAIQAFKHFVIFGTIPRAVEHYCRYVNALKRNQRTNGYSKKRTPKASPASSLKRRR